MVRRKILLLGICLSVITVVFTTTVAATVSVNTTEEYVGGEEGNSQAVEMSYTLSPDDNVINDVRIRVQETGDSFVDFNSFERTVNPATAEADVTAVAEGVFEIDELAPTEEIVLTFQGYPRDLQQEELTVATIDVEYVQQGQSLDETTEITADLSNSPWFQLQDALDRIDELEENGGNGNGGGLNLVFGLLIGIALGAVIGLFVGRELLSTET